MRIGQFSESFLPIVDGVGRVVYSYARGLAKGGDECYVIAPQNNTGYRGGYPFELVDYSAFPVIGSPQYKSGLAVLDKHYLDRIEMIKLDVCHAHTPFFAGQEALRLCSKYNLPLIGTFHSKYYDDFYKATNAELIANIGVKFVVDFYERCDEVWTVSESSAVVLREYGYTGDIIIIENGTEMRPVRSEDKQAAIEKFHIDADNPVFLFVGQINWKKGILRLLEAAAYLKQRGEKFTVVLAGQGPDEEAVKAKADELNVAEHVLFTGHLSDTHLLDGLYQAATLFTFPSRYDTFHQHAQRLPHVDEVHLEGGVLPVGRRRSGLRSCRVRHDAAAASRDDGRGVTAHEAQRKGCGQRQRSEAAHERLSGHFFFFEVFHDVFSFC